MRIWSPRAALEDIKAFKRPIPIFYPTYFSIYQVQPVVSLLRPMAVLADSQSNIKNLAATCSITSSGSATLTKVSNLSASATIQSTLTATPRVTRFLSAQCQSTFSGSATLSRVIPVSATIQANFSCYARLTSPQWLVAQCQITSGGFALIPRQVPYVEKSIKAWSPTHLNNKYSLDFDKKGGNIYSLDPNQQQYQEPMPCWFGYKRVGLSAKGTLTSVSASATLTVTPIADLPPLEPGIVLCDDTVNIKIDSALISSDGVAIS